jgi:hypothetical protein
MNRKVLVIAVALMAVAMLATSLVGSGKKTPTIATFEVTLQTWGDREYNANPPTKSYQTDEGMVIKNFRCHGIPPLIEDLGSITSDDYPDGGIRLTIDVDGDDEYTLIGTMERMVKINIFYGFPAVTGTYAVGKWTFEITAVEDGIENAPENAVGSTMSGWYTVDNGNVYESTHGTGIFHGASMVFSTAITPVMVDGELFAHETAAGDMLFP